MACGSKEVGGVYLPAPTCLRAGTHRQRLRQAGRTRHPQESPFYRLVERFHSQFEVIHEERYQERYGFWRPIRGRLQTVDLRL
jgi:hypothetical protein